MRFFLLPLLLLAAASASPSAPLTVLHGRGDDLVPAVTGVVSGRTLWFDLDTGAHETIFDLNVAQSLHLPAHGATSISGAGKGAVDAVQLDPVAIRLGDVTFRAPAPLATDLSHAGSTLNQGGILGFDFFSRYVVEVNFDTYAVTLYDPHTYAYDGSGSAIPLVIRPPRAFVSVVVSAQGVMPEHHLLRVDLGSNDAVDDDIVLHSSEPTQAIDSGTGLGKPFAARLGTVSELELGPFVLHDLPSATGGVQLIGDAVWHRFNIVFDFSRSVMYLTPRAGTSTP